MLSVAKPYFVRALTPAEIAQDLALLRTDSTIIPITHEVRGVASHPEDDVVLSVGLSGRVRYVITSDRQLLRLGEYEGPYIVSAVRFLSMLPGLLP